MRTVEISILIFQIAHIETLSIPKGRIFRKVSPDKLILPILRLFSKQALSHLLGELSSLWAGPYTLSHSLG